MKTHLNSLIAAAGLSIVVATGAVAQRFELPIPPFAVADELDDRGYETLADPRLRGDVYVVDALDRRGMRVRLIVDAFDGTLLEQLRLAGARAGEPRRAPWHRREAWIERDTRIEREVRPQRDHWRPIPPRGFGPIPFDEEVELVPPRSAFPSRAAPPQRLAARPDIRLPESRLPERAPLPPPRPSPLPFAEEPADPPPEAIARGAPSFDLPDLPEVESTIRAPRELTPAERDEIIPAFPEAGP